MSETRDALVRLRAAIHTLERSGTLPTELATARAVVSLKAGTQRAAAPKDSVLNGVRRNLEAAARSSVGIAGALPHDLRDAPWLLWTEYQPLAELPGLLDLVEQRAARAGPARRRLIEAWILGFSRSAPRIEEGGSAIRRLLARETDSRFEIWRDADRKWQFFDPPSGPRSVAATILGGSESVDAILTAAGLDDPLRAVGGYARAVQDDLLSQLPAALNGHSALVAFARSEEFLVHGNKLRFQEPEAQGAIARGLLAPWLRGVAAPPAALQSAVQGFLLKHLGDPRRRKSAWQPAGEEATALMRRWLGRASFQAFFDLISDLASDRQWKYRKAFWSAYLNEEHVDDIWLALASTLHESAQAVKDLDGAYAKLSGASYQAVLVFRIKHLVLCEWSNIGKLRAWPQAGKQAPRPYEEVYSAGDLKSPSMAFEGPSAQLSRHNGLSHIGPENGSWQRKAASFITRETGIRLMGPRDWRIMP